MTELIMDSHTVNEMSPSAFENGLNAVRRLLCLSDYSESQQSVNRLLSLLPDVFFLLSFDLSPQNQTGLCFPGHPDFDWWFVLELRSLD